MSVSDQLLMAYADGELGPQQHAAVEAAVAVDADLSARLEAHIRLRNTMSAAFADVTSEPVPDRLLQASRMGEAANLVAFRRKPTAPSPRWWGLSGGLIAAGLAIGIFIGPALRSPAGTAPVGNGMLARGDLAQALDHQMASTQRGGVVRIGLTFRTGSGQVCRTFQIERSAAAAGLACHQHEGWMVRVLAPAQSESGDSTYQTASSTTPSVVANLAQSLIFGSPMDARAEAQARDRHWSPK